MKSKIILGDCLEVLKQLDDNSIDAVVTDPPYGLVSINKRWSGKEVKNTPGMETKEGSVWARKAKGFMGKEWDGSGTTGIACKNLNRDFIGIEKDEEYVKIAKARIKATPNNLFQIIDEK